MNFCLFLKIVSTMRFNHEGNNILAELLLLSFLSFQNPFQNGMIPHNSGPKPPGHGPVLIYRKVGTGPQIKKKIKKRPTFCPFYLYDSESFISTGFSPPQLTHSCCEVA